MAEVVKADTTTRETSVSVVVAATGASAALLNNTLLQSRSIDELLRCKWLSILPDRGEYP